MAATKKPTKTKAANPETGKPQMAAQERDWHEHNAGIAASTQAGKSDSELGLNVLDQSSGNQYETACGWNLRPATIGTTIELSKLAAWAEGLPELKHEGELREREIMFLTLTAMAYADTLRFRQIRLAGGFDGLIAEAEKINYHYTPDEQKKMYIHVGASIATINALADAQNSIVKDDAPPASSGGK